MKRPPVLAMTLLGLPCLLAVCDGRPAFADSRGAHDPYEICRDRGLGTAEFNRCISEVYIEEVRKADMAGELERALRGHESAGGSALHGETPCLFDPAAGAYQECHLTSAGDQCLQYAGPFAP